jgi:hypothetical protein
MVFQVMTLCTLAGNHPLNIWYCDSEDSLLNLQHYENLTFYMLKKKTVSEKLIRETEEMKKTKTTVF